MSSRSRISVIIPVHGGGKDFEACLGSLQRSHVQPLEVIVIADRDPQAARYARKWGAQVRQFSSPTGPSAARNCGAHAARGEILFFVDADVEIHPDTLEKVGLTFAAEPDLDALIGSYDDSPAASNFLSQYRNLLHHYTHQTAERAVCTFWGACGAIKRDVFFEVGGFDERFRRPCIEDIEFGHRLSEAGCMIRLCKELQVTHRKRWTPGSMLTTDVFSRGVPWTKLLLQQGSMADNLNTDVTSRLSILSIWLLAGGLVLTPWMPVLLAGVFVLAGTFVALNRSFYTFLARRRGLLFALTVIPWHGLYYFYSGVAFAIGLVQYASPEAAWSSQPWDAG